MGGTGRTVVGGPGIGEETSCSGEGLVVVLVVRDCCWC